MGIIYTLLYKKRVLSDDLPKISAPVKGRIQEAILAKLRTTPENFGKPLRKTLRGYRVLRVGEYRVIFHIVPENHQVVVVIIGHRSTVYELAEWLLR